MRIGIAGTGRIGAFHATTLRGLDFVDALVLTDLNHELGTRVAADLDAAFVPTLDDLLGQVDALVITTGTPAHAPTLRAGITAGVPTFCEKPVAGTLEETIALTELEREMQVPIHLGFQRRFDVGYRRIREAVAAGELGFIHTIRASSHDASPPPAAFIATSGGLFRDCSIHDFDAIRFVTGAEVRSVYAVGANKGAPFFTEAGDVDTAAAVLTLDDDTLCSVTATRYNGGGHDVRLEVHGSEGSLLAGLDDTFPFTSAETGVAFPPGPRHWTFMDRFLPAYVAELTAFADVARGRIPSPCTIADGLAAFRIADAASISRREGRVVHLDEIPGG